MLVFSSPAMRRGRPTAQGACRTDQSKLNKRLHVEAPKLMPVERPATARRCGVGSAARKERLLTPHHGQMSTMSIGLPRFCRPPPAADVPLTGAGAPRFRRGPVVRRRRPSGKDPFGPEPPFPANANEW